jgi:hypothetical protein
VPTRSSPAMEHLSMKKKSLAGYLSFPFIILLNRDGFISFNQSFYNSYVMHQSNKVDHIK